MPTEMKDEGHVASRWLGRPTEMTKAESIKLLVLQEKVVF